MDMQVSLREVTKENWLDVIHLPIRDRMPTLEKSKDLIVLNVDLQLLCFSRD